MITAVLQALQARGFTRVMCHIPVWNRASTASFARCGFRRLRRIWFVQALGVRWLSTAPQRL